MNRLEYKLDAVMEKLDAILLMNERLIKKQTDFDSTIATEIDQVFSKVGGDNLPKLMEKLKDVDFESVAYVCDAVTSYRQRGMLSVIGSMRLIASS